MFNGSPEGSVKKMRKLKNNRADALRFAANAVIEVIEPRLMLTATATAVVPGQGIEFTGPYGSYMPVGTGVAGATTSRLYSEFGFVTVPITSLSPNYTVNNTAGATGGNANGGVNSITVSLYNSASSGTYAPVAGNLNVYVLPDNDSSTGTNTGGPSNISASSLEYGVPAAGSTPAATATTPGNGTGTNTISSAATDLGALGSTFGTYNAASLGVTSADLLGTIAIPAGLTTGYTSYTLGATTRFSAAAQKIIANDISTYNAGAGPTNTPIDLVIVPAATNPGYVDYEGNYSSAYYPKVALDVNETSDPASETFAVNSTTVSVNEVNALQTVEVDVLRTGITGGTTAYVPYSTTNGTALTGTNYTGTSGTLTFAPGVTQQEIAVTILKSGTNGFAGTKNFTVNLGTATDAGGEKVNAAPTGFTTSTVTIVGNASLTNTAVASPAEDVDDIEIAGPYGTGYAPVNGSSSNATPGVASDFNFQAFEVLNFDPTTTPSVYPATGSTVSSIQNLSLQLTSDNPYTNTAGNSVASNAGDFNVYLLSTSAATAPDSTLAFDTTTVDGVNGQAGALLLGTFSYSANNGADTYTAASFSTAAQTTIQSDLVSDLNSGVAFRLAIAPGSAKFAAEFSGSANAAPAAATPPTLALSETFSAQLSQESLSLDSANVYSATEGNSITVKVDRTGTTTGTETVSYTTGGGNAIAGTNYTTTSGTLTFGSGVTFQTITVPTLYATNVSGQQGGDKALLLTLSSPTVTGSGVIAVLGSGNKTVTTLPATLTVKDANTAKQETLGTSASPILAADAETAQSQDPNSTSPNSVPGIYYNSTATYHSFEIGGTGGPSGTNSYSGHYGVADFNTAQPGALYANTYFTPSATVTEINNITLSLDISSTSGTSGLLNVYLVPDTTSSIAGGVPPVENTTANGGKTFFDTTQTTYPGVGTEFGTPVLLGNVNFDKTFAEDTYEPLPLINYAQTTETTLINDLNNKTKFRIVVTPGSVTSTVYAEAYGNTLSAASGVYLDPELSFGVTEGNTYPVSTLPAWLSSTSQATFNKTTQVLTVTGPSTIIADPYATSGDEPIITGSVAAAQVKVMPATNDIDIHVGGINLSGGAGVDVVSVGAARSHADHNVLVVGTRGSSSNPLLVASGTSKINLEDNDLIVHTGSSDTTGQTDLTTVQKLSGTYVTASADVGEGRNVAPGGIYDGTWTGNGLTSSAAATADSNANAGYEQNILAVVLNSDLFLGTLSAYKVGTASETLGANDIIVKYTYNGDLNLDGAVDGNAATVFSTFYDGGASIQNDYAFGDLNADSKVNGNDATIFSTVFGNGTAGSGLPLL